MSAASTSRRLVLTGAAAVLAAGRATVAHATEPDPVFALIEAERVAYEAFDDAVRAMSRLEAAWMKSEWRRKPRALIGTQTRLVRGPDLEPIPPDEIVPDEPVYMSARDNELVHDETLHRAKWLSSTPERRAAALAKEEERYVEVKARLEEDAAAIKAAEDAFGFPEIEARQNRLSDEADMALMALAAARPTTAAGLLAMLDVVWERTEENMLDPFDAVVKGAFDAVRGLLAGRSA